MRFAKLQHAITRGEVRVPLRKVNSFSDTSHDAEGRKVYSIWVDCGHLFSQYEKPGDEISCPFCPDEATAREMLEVVGAGFRSACAICAWPLDGGTTAGGAGICGSCDCGVGRGPIETLQRLAKFSMLDEKCQRLAFDQYRRGAAFRDSAGRRDARSASEWMALMSAIKNKSVTTFHLVEILGATLIPEEKK